TGDSVTRIAYRNGFRSTNAFIEYFRRRYGTTPGKYRKSMAGEQKITGTTTARDLSDYIQTLLKYDDTPDELAAAQPARIYRATVDTTRQGLPVCRPWSRLVNIGYARDGLFGAVQEQLRRAKQELGFTDLRFHGIFDDDKIGRAHV